MTKHCYNFAIISHTMMKILLTTVNFTAVLGLIGTFVFLIKLQQLNKQALHMGIAMISTKLLLYRIFCHRQFKQFYIACSPTVSKCLLFR